MALFYH